MANSNNISALRDTLARKSNTHAQDWYPTFKARYGMCAVFEALRKVRGDGAVLTQLFTCCTAVDPILAAQLHPIYGDVDPDTLALNASLTLEGRAIRSSLAQGQGVSAGGAASGGSADTSVREDAGNLPVHAVITQHTFGLIDSEADARLAKKTRELGAVLMEDNAHALTRISRLGDGTPLPDVSVHSFGVEKILSETRFGAAIWVNPDLGVRMPEVDRAIRAALSDLAMPDLRVGLAARMYRNQIRVFARLPQGLNSKVRSALQKVHLFEPAISPAERVGQLEYGNIAITDWVARTAVKYLENIEANLHRRAEIVRIYRDEFSQICSSTTSLTIPQAALKGEPQPLLLFPLLCKDDAASDAVRSRAREHHVRAVRWYNTILFPGITQEAPYYVPCNRGIAGELTHRSVGLPTDVTPDAARSAARAIAAIYG